MLENSQIDVTELQKFQPFDQLSPADLAKLVPLVKTKSLPVGTVIFKAQDTDRQAIYLMLGEVELLSGRTVKHRIKATSKEALAPLGHTQPRKYASRARTPIEIFWLDAEIVNRLIAKQGLQGAEMDADGSEDWMENLLQSPIFNEIPAANIQKVVMRFEKMVVRKGARIIQQGDEGDYYYFVQTGRCAVIRNDDRTHKEIRLAVLKSGDTFGEESLISGSKRSTSVMMDTDGILFRLNKDDFVGLIKDPILSVVTHQQALQKVAGGAQWLDVRSPESYQRNGLAGSINIPTYALRYQLNKLDQQKEYIAYCEDGRHSASSAFLAQERGYHLSVLQGGLAQGVPTPDVRPSKPKAAVASATDSEVLITQLESTKKALQTAENDKMAMQNTLEIATSKQTDVEHDWLDKMEGLEQEMVETRKDHEREYYGWQKERDQYKRTVAALTARCAASEGAQSKIEAIAQTANDAMQAQHTQVSEQISALNQRVTDLQEEVAQAHSVNNTATVDHETESSLLKQEIEKLEMQLQTYQETPTDTQLLENLSALEQKNVALRQSNAIFQTTLDEDARAQQAAQTQHKALALRWSEQENQLQDNLAQLHQEKNALQAQQQQTEVAQTELKQRLQQMAEEQTHLAQEKTSLIADAQAQEKTYAAQLAQQKEAVTVAHDQLQAQTEQLDKRDAQAQDVAKVVREKAALRQRVEVLEAEQQQIKAAKQQVAAAHKQLQTQLSEAQQNLQDVTENSQKFEQQYTREQEKNTQIEANVTDAKATLSQLIRENKQLADANATLENEVSELQQTVQSTPQVESKQTATDEQLRHALRQEKNALNGKFMAKVKELNSAHKALSECKRNQAVADAEKLATDEKMRDVLAGMVPDEVAALKKELDVIRLHSGEELKALKTQRDKWAAQYAQEHQRAESYKEEFEKLDHAKGNVPEQARQLEYSLHKLKEEYKKLKASREEVDAELVMEKEETQRINQEMIALQKELRANNDDQKQQSAIRMEEQHRLGELQDQLDARMNAQKLMVDDGHKDKAKNSNVFFLFVGMLCGLVFINLVLLWEGSTDIYARLSTTFQIMVMDNSNVAEKTLAPDARKVEQPQAKVPLGALKVFRDRISGGAKGPEIVVLPAGNFIMGNNSRGKQERPEHTVKMPPFAISTHEITFREYDAFATATERALPDDVGWGRDDRPVINVSWRDAMDYARWLSRKTRKTYRLPTEAEWEYATSAGSRSKFWWGFEVGQNNANCFDCATALAGKTAAVGRYQASAYKMFDTAGNVYEWVADCYHVDYKGAPTDGSEWQGGDCSQKMVRGGSFRNLSSQMGTTKRKQYRAENTADDLGFRLVREIP